MIRFIALFLIWFLCCGASYDIGGGGNDYATVSAFLSAVSPAAGDTINIYPGTYTDKWILSSGGASGNRITFQGVDAGGNPLTAPANTVEYNCAGMGDVPYELRDSADYITFTGLSWRDWDHVSAASTLIKNRGDHNIFKWCLWKDNDENTYGTWTESSGATLLYCEFDGGGSDTHLIYSFASGYLWIEGCYFHDFADATTGQLIKSRDWDTIIKYNMIEMGVAQIGVAAVQAQGGNTPVARGYQDSYIIGNVFIKDDDDWTRCFIQHAEDDGDPRIGNCYVISNVFHDKTGAISKIFDISTGGAYDFEYSNNILYDTDLSGLTYSAANSAISGYNNWQHASLTQDLMTGTVTGTSPGFTAVNSGSSDYSLTPSSDCINAGYNNASGVSYIPPTEQYAFHYSTETRPSDATIDIGPYEYEAAAASPGGVLGGPSTGGFSGGSPRGTMQ